MPSESLLPRARAPPAGAAWSAHPTAARSLSGSRRAGGRIAAANARSVLGEAIADPPHREDQLGVLRIALDLLAQVGDVDVAGPDVSAELGLPELLHDLLAREDLARVLGEQPQHLELRAGQVDRLPSDGDQVACQVDRHRAGLDRGALHAARTIQFTAAQLRPHPAEQLAHREGLGDVVVRTDLEPDHLVDLGVLGGQQDDRDRAVRSDLAADVEAALAGHHDVQDQQVEVLFRDLALGLLAVRGERDLEALLLERVAD